MDLDKLIERAKLIEREVELNRREMKLIQREAQINAIGSWPLTPNMFGAPGGGVFITVGVMPMSPMAPSGSNGGSVADQKFEAAELLATQTKDESVPNAGATSNQTSVRAWLNNPAGSGVK